MVYVDNLLPSNGPIFSNNDSCRLIADNEQELENFAKKLNLSPFWKIDNTVIEKSPIYYHLTKQKRDAAIKLGAYQITNEQMDVLLNKNKSGKTVKKTICGYACIGLENPKFSSNVGGIMRAAYNYDVKTIFIRGNRYIRTKEDTPKAHASIPVITTDDLYKVIPFDCVPVGVDIVPRAQPLYDYIHPERAFYIFGAEDATLGKRTLSWCRDVIYVPTRSCMNLAAAANVILYDRLNKGIHNE